MASLSSSPSLFFFLGVSLILLLPLTTGQGISEPPALSPTPTATPSSVSDLIRQVCKASRDPATCFSLMSQSDHVPSDATLFVVVQSAVWISSENLNLALSMVNDLLVSAGDNQNLTIAARHCLEGLIYSVYRTGLTAEGLPRGKLKDARAWMSAAQSNEFGCSSGLSKVNGTSKLNQTVSFLNNLGMLTNNALGMIVNYDIYGEDTESWVPPRTERDGFWEPVVGSGSGSGFGSNGGVPAGLKPDVTVCKAGGCDYKTVQEAVDAAPGNLVGRRFVIGIKEGVYEETVRVPLAKKNVVFLGDGMGKTVITGSLNVGMPGMTTMDSATVGVVGDGFMASGITFKNTAGPPTFQAVAFRSVADHTVIENCEFLGNQDTLYAHSLRQFYKSNRIQGNVDFIFGNAAAVFQDCLIFICPRQSDPEHGENNAVTAHSRNDPSQSTGFVFNNCTINGTEEYLALYKSKPSVHKNYLGRPWKEYSRTVFINSTLEELISAEGWMPWDGEFALKTLYYGEFGNKGAGANVTGRVKWSNQIPEEHVISYSVQNFIQGEDWIPTGSC